MNRATPTQIVQRGVAASRSRLPSGTSARCRARQAGFAQSPARQAGPTPSPARQAGPTPATRRMMTWAAAVLLGVFLAAGTALAIDQPPQGADQQRDWLVGHLVGDMQALGTFDGNTLAKLPGIVKGLTDDQVALLAQYYFLTRSKTEQDAAIYAMQQQRCTVEQLNAARAEIADLLAAMNNQIEACYAQFRRCPSRSNTSPRPATPACRAGAAVSVVTFPAGTTPTAASSVLASMRLMRVHGQCRSAMSTTTTTATSIRCTATSPRRSTSTAASARRRAAPTGSAVRATGTRPWRTTGFCTRADETCWPVFAPAARITWATAPWRFVMFMPPQFAPKPATSASATTSRLPMHRTSRFGAASRSHVPPRRV